MRSKNNKNFDFTKVPHPLPFITILPFLSCLEQNNKAWLPNCNEMAQTKTQQFASFIFSSLCHSFYSPPHHSPLLPPPPKKVAGYIKRLVCATIQVDIDMIMLALQLRILLAFRFFHQEGKQRPNFWTKRY